MEGTPKAIEMKGIVRNATKIGVQDGQAEDLINLRFMDGSWRASGNGRHIVNMPTGTIYEQMYVHTNVYHHLIGVNNGTLYWFAEIDNDGVTFYPLDGTTDRSLWPEEMKDLPTERKELTTVVGDVWITQTGHLLTVIDESDDFDHFVFKTGENKYLGVNMDVNGKQTDRSLYPFNFVHINCFCPEDGAHKVVPEIGDAQFKTIYQATGIFTTATRKKNLFSQHFLAIVAFKLYDGSYAFACNPVHLCPREYLHYQPGAKRWANVTPYGHSDFNILIDTTNAIVDSETRGHVDVSVRSDDGVLTVTSDNAELVKGISPWVHWKQGHKLVDMNFQGTLELYGSDLVLSFDGNLIEGFDENIFQSICVFVTTESNVYATVSSMDDLRNRFNEYDIVSDQRLISANITYQVYENGEYKGTSTVPNPDLGPTTFYPSNQYAVFRKKEDIIYDLLHSPFYLIREYKKSELYELAKNPVINLQDAAHKGILQTENLVQQPQLPIEATSRTTYLPKVSYMYNGRLHIANYKSHPFFGYPIDLFHLHNHSVKVQDGEWFKGVLPNIADNNDAYLQYPRTKHDFPATYSNAIKYFAYITVDIDNAQGMQRVVRYIEPYSIGGGKDGLADFIESLNPLLTYPDARAKKMSIYILKEETTYQGGAMYLYYNKTVDLKPHPYLNMAYYIDPNLKPIEFSVYPVPNDPHALPEMQNTEEYFPNGLKVSKTDQPMFFPVENTYQVGSAEILALMSNTIAVGTGQTGDAPLYVFCKDGVYALYVDSSGKMAYPNARILARDVCNNPRSVTPIDAGVVFTTDRGLMMIAGEQVQEIGAQAEGDVVQFWNAGSVDYSKIATASMQQIAGLPSNLCSTTDFLTYLQDKGTSGKAAIINYNHNMRELMVSNPNYPYSYVLDREGNWSRRDYTAAQYVNNYPTSYRVDKYGHFYKVDDEGDASTSLEHRKEADNKIFYLSNVIKLDSIGFKQAYRFVVRGYFETMFATQDMITDTIYDRKIIVMGPSIDNIGIGEILRMAYINIYGIDAWVAVDEHGSVGNILTLRIYDAYTLEDITTTFCHVGFPSDYITIIKTANPDRPAIACVVEGSYDGRKFKPLGYNRKSGKFRDIGCIVERTDVRFFRVCLSGQVTGKTRIDYMEMSAGASMLNTKIR